MHIIKVSPKGQITIPKSARDAIKSDRLVFEMHNKTIILKPTRLVIDDEHLGQFSNLSEKSFEFWDNKEDDIYQEFYEKV